MRNRDEVVRLVGRDREPVWTVDVGRHHPGRDLAIDKGAVGPEANQRDLVGGFRGNVHEVGALLRRDGASKRRHDGEAERHELSSAHLCRVYTGASAGALPHPEGSRCGQVAVALHRARACGFRLTRSRAAAPGVFLSPRYGRLGSLQLVEHTTLIFIG